MDIEQKLEYWRGQIDAQQSSGKTVREYCAENGIKEWKYYAWKTRLNKPAGAKTTTTETFMPISITGISGLQIHFGDKVRLEAGDGCSETLLRIALEILSGRTKCWR